ncbi:hypothetical protein SAMN05444008_11789 [Cnuella takakiae]|uniref:Uncharacterized protein n=1 Tax=Cnuella takakiae TaxID=1302690 RepID=A0A1M5GWM5_9BACT|nr:DUF6134 family protein [Cnuella takakiae]OLY90862.1 hypothetical protein BUE76_02340 [Cnuella takakiae]SHG08110.1 hypothetical protein SAMN05444008_11789 [Cnuella takakiae]
MITLLLLLWLRRLKAGTPRHTYRFHPLLFSALLLLLGIAACAQQKHFTIYRNGKPVGHLQLQTAQHHGTTRLKLESEVQTRIVTLIRIKATEESWYQQEQLVYASVRRTINGLEKENRTLTAVPGGCRLNEDGRQRHISHPPVGYSTLSLYAREPLQRSHVFSDSHAQLVPIRKIEAGHYQVALPDGKINEFWYSGGRCNRVVLRSRWFTAEMIADN